MLDEHEKRELRQLWFGASQYLELAEGLKAEVEPELERTTADVADGFVAGVPRKESHEYKLAVLGAHIASVGIRLGSIHEVLNRERIDCCRDALKKSNAQEVAREFDADLANYISILLRDNVAHVEGEDLRWKRREDYLAKKTYRQVYEAVLEDSAETAKQLRTEGVL